MVRRALSALALVVALAGFAPAGDTYAPRWNGGQPYQSRFYTPSLVPSYTPRSYWPAYSGYQTYPTYSSYGGYGQISPYNGLPRTNPVQGYLRRDGVYVPSYYRSR